MNENQGDQGAMSMEDATPEQIMFYDQPRHNQKSGKPIRNTVETSLIAWEWQIP